MTTHDVAPEGAPASPYARDLWVSEHFWPGTAEELVFAQAQRLAAVAGCVSCLVLSGQQLVIGCFVGDDRVIARALAASGLAATLRPGWELRPDPPTHHSQDRRTP